MTPAIYTEKTECRDCYKCVRHCPVKAIRVEDSSASIDHSLCIFCGRCVAVCPVGAKRIRNDVERVRKLLAGKAAVYVSLAPSYPVCFSAPEETVIARLLKLGFTGVSETALGAEAVAREEHIQMEREPGLRISSACPSVRILANRYFPRAAERMSTLPSPMVVHAKMLRRWYGNDIGVVFVGPCIAKKMEADQYPDLIDAALTADELSAWLTEAEETGSTSAGRSDESHFVPHRAGKAALFPVDGGMISAMGQAESIKCRSFSQSGTGLLMETLREIDRLQAEPLFLELLACEGGCINGPGLPRDLPLLARRSRILTPQNAAARAVRPEYLPNEITDSRWEIVLPPGTNYSEEEIEAALRKLGKESLEERKECGGCGYSTCRDFAVAFLDGKAEQEMCVTEMRRLAQNKVSALLHTIPMGVVLVDSELRIVECNRRFLTIFAELSFEPDQATLKRAEGSRIDGFFTETELFTTLLSREGTEERIIKSNGKVMRGTFFQIRIGSLVGAVFQDITAPAVRQETVVKKAEEVIRKSLESVQQIAGLLGENAAETEIILNSMIDAWDPGTLPSEADRDS